MNLTEFLLARIAEDEAVARVEIGRRDVVLVGPFAPARVLAECEAKRRLVAFADEVVGAMDMQIQGEWGSGPILPEHDEELRMLRLLAIPYADHPDYDPTWRP